MKKKIFHGKFRLYSSFPDFERWLNVIFVKKGFRGACQKCLLRVPKTFWRKQSFKHFIICDLFQNLSVNLLAGWSKLPLRVHWNVFGNFYILEIIFLLSFPHIMWNFFATSTNEIGRVVKLAFILSSGTIWKRSSLNGKVLRCSSVLNFEQNYPAEWSYLLPRCREELSEGKQNFKKYSIFFQFGWLTSGRVENLNLGVPKTFFGKFFWKINFLSWISDWEQIFCEIFSEMLPKKFSELTSVSDFRTKWGEQFFMENTNLSYQLRTLSNP